MLHHFCVFSITVNPFRGFSNTLHPTVRRADIAIAGFALTNQRSLEVCDDMIEQMREIKPDVIMVAVGDRIDHLKYERQVTEEFAREHFAKMQPPIEYFETYAKAGEGVNELFEAAIRLWINANLKPSPEQLAVDRPTSWCRIM